jgi:hypothetical protein
MNRYRLCVRVPNAKGLGETKITLITEDLVKLSAQFAGHLEGVGQAGQDSYEWRYQDLMDDEHLLECKVVELERKHSIYFAVFTLSEYTPKASAKKG